jgi:isopenicillin-N epimerase
MSSFSRRDFARLFAISGTGAIAGPLRSRPVGAQQGGSLPPIGPAGLRPDESYWKEVRRRFVLPADLGYMNAANLCPASLPTIEALERDERALDADPSGPDRTRLGQARETARSAVATMLGVTPEEIVLTRNTSEANNLVSSGLQLGSGDEVVVFADNHPSANAAWKSKAERFGFQVVTVPVVSPHPGADAYVEAFSRALTPRTRVLAITQVTNSVGDLLPAREICAMARARGVLTLVDGAQTFGVLDVDLRELGADFYSGSLHKWPCGPKETGVLFLAGETHDRVWPSIVSLYPGAVGASRKLEGMGQRDEAALAALGSAVDFQTRIGRSAIETRVRALTQALISGLRAIDGVTVWTSTDPARSLGVVTAKPAALDVRAVASSLREKDRIVVAARGGQDRPGLRFSPHLYNTMDEIERSIGAVKRLVARGA